MDENESELMAFIRESAADTGSHEKSLIFCTFSVFTPTCDTWAAQDLGH